MIDKIPETWEYSDDLEMLYFFYQVTDELLSEITPDTYSLPSHNSLSLVYEIIETYSLLEKQNSIDGYYAKYIPPIIDELLVKIKEDHLLKKLLDKRLASIVSGLEESKKNNILLTKWLELFQQSCSAAEYRRLYKNEIINLVVGTKDKIKLLYCIKNFYISLTAAGYSREYLYVSAKRFFDNNSIKINSKNQIRDFLAPFTCALTKYEFLILMDMKSIEYLNNISDNINITKDIQKVDVDKERSLLCNDRVAESLVREYEIKKSRARDYQQIEIVRMSDKEFDPYRSMIKFRDYVHFLQTFKQYFVHHHRTKQVFAFLLKKQDGGYVKLDIPNELKKRPFVSQELIDSRIKNILSMNSLGYDAFFSLARAMEMHADAFDSSNTSKLRSFWTALETLFSVPGNNNITRDNVIHSTLAIVQKTYILKIMRALFAQVSATIPEDDLKNIGIFEFPSFVRYFSAHKEDSVEMKLIYGKLGNNPLLRSRIFAMRKKFGSGTAISKLLKEHNTKIEWQLQRLYRIRNISTHLGTEIAGTETAINHLHNYFDYVVNYMLCKSENGNFVPNIAALVFESKNDIKIHLELLKSEEPLSDNNYMHYLFGPDINLIKYQFEY